MRSGQGFKKLSVLALIMAILFSAVAPALAGSADSLKKAAELEKNASYFKAVKMYERAAREAGRENNQEILMKSNHRLKQIEKIFISYPYDKKQAEKALAKALPMIDKKERGSWFETNKINDYILIDGKPYYNQSFIANILFRDDAVYAKVNKSKSRAFFGSLYDIIYRPADAGFKPDAALPNINPVFVM